MQESLKDHICDTLAEVEEKAEENLSAEIMPRTEYETWTAVLNLCRCVKLLSDEMFAADQRIKELGEALREAKKAAEAAKQKTVVCKDCDDYERDDSLKEAPEDDEKGRCLFHCIDTWVGASCSAGRRKSAGEQKEATDAS